MERLVHEGKQYRRLGHVIERYQEQKGRGWYWTTVHPGPLYRTLEKEFNARKPADDEFPPLRSISITGR